MLGDIYIYSMTLTLVGEFYVLSEMRHCEVYPNTQLQSSVIQLVCSCQIHTLLSASF